MSPPEHIPFLGMMLSRVREQVSLAAIAARGSKCLKFGLNDLLTTKQLTALPIVTGESALCSRHIPVDGIKLWHHRNTDCVSL